MTRTVASALGIAAVLGLGAVVWATTAPADRDPVPVAAVQQGTVEVAVHTNGEIRASRAIQVFAPPVGGILTIVSLAATGAALEAGDLIVEFDAADQQFALEQAKADLALAEQEIVKAEAQAAVQAAEDAVALLQARYAVRRAELDASGNELVGAITAKQNLLLLDEARARRAQLERDIATRRASARASTDALRERANKARAAVALAERNIRSLRIVAPFDGHVTVRPNMMALGGIIFSGAIMPDFRVGDSAFPGNAIADLVDTSRLEVTSKLAERDRANIEAGRPATVAVDGLPNLVLEGKVRSVSSVASRRMFEAGGTRQFDIAFEILKAPARVWPGTSAAVTIRGATFEDALFVPRSAVFDADGTPVVYVQTADGFAPRPVKVRAWTDTLAVLDAIEPGTLVALVDPTKSDETSNTGGAAPPVPSAGGAS